MSAPAQTAHPPSLRQAPLAGAVFCLGWLVLYLPAYLDFAEGAWRRAENGHALFIMAVIAGAAGARLAAGGFVVTKNLTAQVAGLASLGSGLAAFAIGRAAEADVITSASQGPVALGVVLILFGWRGVLRLWFALAMIFYLIIWPGWLLDGLTAPLKMLVSQLVANGLHAAGLPVAHAGAVIAAGPYQLLVADACSGLNSLIALTSVGAIYLYAAKHDDWRVNAVVIASLAPIAILANILRVTILVLITYYFGYDAGQGFLHDGAGLVMFAAALASVFAVDALAMWAFSMSAKGWRS